MNTRNMVKYFDIAFRLRENFPDMPVLLYALGVLFGITYPRVDVARVAQSGITQALLCEPGAAQKAFALLSFWHLNGLALDAPLLTSTINRMIARHQASGFSNDVAWALAFCLEQNYALDTKAGRVLSAFDDDCIALQSLHMERRGLLPKGFSSAQIAKALKDADLDREHWLISYETVRHGFLSVCEKAVKSNPFFSELLNHQVTFYSETLAAYATTIHPGSAPGWVVKKWIDLLKGTSGHTTTPAEKEIEESPLLRLIGQNLAETGHAAEGGEESAEDLVDILVSNVDLSELGAMSG